MGFSGLKNILELIQKNPANLVLRERFLVLLFELEENEKLTWVKALATSLQPIDPREALKFAYMIYQHSPDRLQLGFLADCLDILGRKDVASEVRSHINHVDATPEDAVDAARPLGHQQLEQEPYKSHSSLQQDADLPQSKFILESLSSSSVPSFPVEQEEHTELLNEPGLEGEEDDDRGLEDVKTPEHENHDPLGILQDQQPFALSKNVHREDVLTMASIFSTAGEAFKKSLHDGLEQAIHEEKNLTETQNLDEALSIDVGLSFNQGGFQEELATQMLFEDNHLMQEESVNEVALHSSETFIPAEKTEMISPSSSAVDDSLLQGEKEGVESSPELIEPEALTFHNVLEFQGALQSLLVGYDKRLLEQGRHHVLDSHSQEWSETFYQDLLEYIQQDDESVDSLVFALFDHHRSLSLAKILDESGLWGVDASYFGLYLDSLLAAGSARRALVMIQYKMNETSSDEWIQACQRRLPDIWDQLGVRGPLDLKSLSREKFLEVVQQRQRPTWKGVLSF